MNIISADEAIALIEVYYPNYTEKGRKLIDFVKQAEENEKELGLCRSILGEYQKPIRSISETIKEDCKGKYTISALKGINESVNS